MAQYQPNRTAILFQPKASTERWELLAYCIRVRTPKREMPLLVLENNAVVHPTLKQF